MIRNLRNTLAGYPASMAILLLAFISSITLMLFVFDSDALAAESSPSGNEGKVSTLLVDEGEQESVSPFDGLKKGRIREDYYSIISKANSRRVQVRSSKTANGSKIVIAKKSKSDVQKWFFRSASKSDPYSYRIQSLQSGRYIALSKGKVIEAKFAKKNNQVWVVGKVGGSYVFVNKEAGLALSVSGKTGLIAVERNDSSKAQRFKLAKTDPLQDGSYFIQPKSSSKVIGVTGHLTKVGSNVVLQGKSSSASKKWVATRNSDGTYTFRNANSARVLSVNGSKAKKGSNVHQSFLASSKNKKWKLELNVNGGINIVSASNDKYCLGSSTLSSGSNTKMIKSKNSKSAIFDFTKTKKPSNRSAMERKVKNISSSTDWLIATNTGSCFVGIFKGKKGNWTPYAYFPCSPGAYGSPSKKGLYKVGLKGYVFGSGFSCYYYTQYSGNYLFHSILYNQGTFTVQDGRMGVHASHGCIRLELANAKWINKNIPKGSSVYVY